MFPSGVRNCARVPDRAEQARVRVNNTTPSARRFITGRRRCSRENPQLSNQSPQLPSEQTVIGHDPVFVFAGDRLVPEIAARAFQNPSPCRDVPPTDARLEGNV